MSSEETWGGWGRRRMFISPFTFTQVGSVRVVFISEESILLEGSQRQILVKPQGRKK
jgi:hypothetical protein